MSKFQMPKAMRVKKSDVFSKELEDLVTFGTGMTWQEDETITFACSGAHEMMDTDFFDLPNEPSHEYRQEEAEKLREASIKSEEERVRLYGTDDGVMEMLCDETVVDLNRGLWRLKRGEDLQEQIVAMKQLRKEGNYEAAHKSCMWLLEQHERHGVGYDKALLHILKQTAASLRDEIHLGKALKLNIRLTST